MGVRFTIIFIMAVTAYAALIVGALTQASPVWRLWLLYAIAAFTPGLLGPLIARGVRWKERED